MKLTCGIDLGTTYSAISYYDELNQRVVTVELVNAADGAREIRSVVYYPAGGGVVVGDTAYNANRQYPDRVVIGVKRSMGTDWKFEVDGRKLSAPEISAEILRVLIQEAEAILGEKVEEVVITVPAFFGDAERSATLQAGQLAGVKVIGILSEPSAAALAFVTEQRENINDRDLLVYDLGGGTFDVTLIRAQSVPLVGGEPGGLDRNIRLATLRKDGNSYLGGLNWDEELAALVGEKAAMQHKVDVVTDPRSKAYLLENCEKAKRDLSRPSVDSITVVVDLNGHSVDVTRQEFEDRTQGLLFQTESLVEQVLQDAVALFQDRAKAAGQPALASIDLAYVKAHVDVLLAGGSTKMKMVKALLERLMGRPPLQYGNPHLLVSIGAAYYAHLLKTGFTAEETGTGPNGPRPGGTGRPPEPPLPGPTTTTGPQVEIVEITRESVGIAALRVMGRDAAGADSYEEVHAIILPKGAAFGASRAQEFAKVNDNMTEIEIAIYKGESAKLDSGCILLKTFTISDLPPNGRKGEIIDVSLRYDHNGILQASATDRVSGKSASVELTNAF